MSTEKSNRLHYEDFWQLGVAVAVADFGAIEEGLSPPENERLSEVPHIATNSPIWRIEMGMKNMFVLFLVCIAAQVRPSFALNASSIHRYLAAQNNVPLLKLGDSPLSLLVNLSLPQMATYTSDQQSAQVIYIGGRDQTHVLQQLKTAAQFYGLGLRSFFVKGWKKNQLLRQALREPQMLAVVVDADILGDLNRHELSAALKRKNSTHVPLLIAGAAGNISPELLRRWSGNAVAGCRGPVRMGANDFYLVGQVPDIGRQLSGHLLVNSGEAIHFFSLGASANSETILTAVTTAGHLPVFVRSKTPDGPVFLTGELVSSGPRVPPDFYGEPSVFAALAPMMMFLRYAAGERAWHMPGHYANLTIDDAWLHEPFGPLNYAKLLQEMEHHNFHTTIAFIPWNFDRSETPVVSLIRGHLDRFSISVHGDNHDHKEFGSLADKPLSEQAARLRQAIARMDRFSAMTQIPFDQIMVFPHSIAQVQVFQFLKQYNFLATVNSHDVPMGLTPPADPDFALRPMTLAFSNFPSVSRYSAEIPISNSQLVIDAFFGNPMLFYVHPPYFGEGIARFDAVADNVNQLQPDTQWKGLGYIARHLYLERLRADGNYDVEAFTSQLQLENNGARERTYFVDKQEDFAIPFTLTVDGQHYNYGRVGDHVRLQLMVPAGGSRQVCLEYQSDFDPATVDVTKSSLRIALLRHLSDFRDSVLSRSTFGRGFTVWYTGLEEGGRLYILWLIFTMPPGAAVGVYLLRKKRRSVNS